MVRSFDRTSTSLRIRLITIILVLVGPLAIFQALEIWQVRTTRTRLTQQHAYEIAQAAAVRYQDTIDDVRSVLDVLSRVKEVTDQALGTCSQFLGGIVPSHPWARSFFLADKSGRVICATNPASLNFDLSTRDWYQKAKAAGPFSVSDFVLSQVTGLPSAFAVLFFRNPANGEEQLIAAGFDLAWFDRLAEATIQRPDALMMLVDNDGIVLSRYPRSPVPGHGRIPSALKAEIYLPRESLFSGIDPDGQQRLFGAFKLTGTQTYVAVGFDRSAALGLIDKYIVIAALIFGGVMVLGALAVWFIGDRIFVRPMRELAGYLRVTLDTMDQGLIAIDRHGRASIMNARVVKLLGLPQQFMTSHPHQDEILAYQRSQGEFASDEQFEIIRSDIERRVHKIYERRRPDGTVLEIRTVPAPEGGIVRTYTDISQRRAAEEALRREIERAEAAAAATSEFLANMSHELRTPLTAIIGISEMLLKEAHSPERQRQFIEMQRTAGQGLLSVISDVLDFSKIEAGQLDLDIQPFELERQLNACMDIIAEEARRKNLNLTFETFGEIPRWVSGDAARLRQIILNLMSNAVKFTHFGSIKLSIEAVPAEPGRLRVSVADTGIGIEPDQIASIFDRFVQAERSTARRFGGSGLGLSISRKLVGLMGGEITVRSEKGRGSTFTFSVLLPPCEQPGDGTGDVVVRGGAYRILLAEDNDLNRQLIKAMLEQQGHEVTAVDGGAEAIRAAVRVDFDAILMDVQMPDIDGYQATRAIRKATRESPALPIIALTANVLSDEADRCLQAGMNGYFAKPISWNALFERMDHLVGLYRATDPGTGGGNRLDALAPDGLPTLNRTTLNHIRETLGDESAANLVKLFAIDARLQFQLLGSREIDQAAIAKKVHSFGGSAGLLGFDRLTDACRMLCAGVGGAMFADLLAECRLQCEQALDEIDLCLNDGRFAEARPASAREVRLP